LPWAYIREYAVTRILYHFDQIGRGPVDDEKVRADFSSGAPDDGDSTARWVAPRMTTTDVAQVESPGRLKTDDITSSSAASP
jgi:hypothetical protein